MCFGSRSSSRHGRAMFALQPARGARRGTSGAAASAGGPSRLCQWASSRRVNEAGRRQRRRRRARAALGTLLVRREPPIVSRLFQIVVDRRDVAAVGLGPGRGACGSPSVRRSSHSCSGPRSCRQMPRATPPARTPPPWSPGARRSMPRVRVPPPQSSRAYRRCATLAVRARVAANQLPPRAGATCSVTRSSRSAADPARRSAAACADGRTRHGVVSAPASCADTATFMSCVSTRQSVPIGCDAAGCVPPPVCGNGAIEPGEAGDPPDQLHCDLACHQITCDLPPTSCGNGVVDAGEACEPPGAGDCTSDCQLATCAAPAPGVVAIACMPLALPGVYAPTVVAAARRRPDISSGGAGSTVRRARRPGATLRRRPLARRRGPHGRDRRRALRQRALLAVDQSRTARSTMPSGAPSGRCPDGGPTFEAIDGRRLGGSGGVQAIDQLAFTTPVGFCRTDIDGPTVSGGVSPSRFAVGYREIYCVRRTDVAPPEPGRADRRFQSGCERSGRVARVPDRPRRRPSTWRRAPPSPCSAVTCCGPGTWPTRATSRRK